MPGVRISLQAYIPTHGLIGFEFELMNLTRGHGIHSHLFREYAPHAGCLQTRNTGTLVCSELGEATAYALDTIQDRGKLFVEPGEQVYEGMIVGGKPAHRRSAGEPDTLEAAHQLPRLRRQQRHPAHPADPLQPEARHRIHRARWLLFSLAG